MGFMMATVGLFFCFLIAGISLYLLWCAMVIEIKLILAKKKSRGNKI